MYLPIVFSPPMYASLRSFKRWSTAMYFLFRLGGCDPASSWTAAISDTPHWNECPTNVFFDVFIKKLLYPYKLKGIDSQDLR